MKTKKAGVKAKTTFVKRAPAGSIQPSFEEVVSLIEQARKRAYQAVTTHLIDLYWKVGGYISRKIAADGWGKGTVKELSMYIQRRQQGIRGFSPQNLWRMRQFFDVYSTTPKLSPLVRELPWAHNLIILTQAKRPQAREFYLRMASRERWGKRELERQLRQALFERTVLHPPKLSPAVREIHGAAVGSVLKDAYFLEFLDLPLAHTEDDLHRGLLARLKDFLVELGRDFCFVGSEYPVQVGGRDFALDLLFFHRGLNCLVAIELKVGRFEPEYLGKLEFYLEALDRDHRKAHENPAMGVLLCASKDSEVVEYALSRSLSPALIAEYQTQLPDKKLLALKLHEFYALNATEAGTDKPAKRAKKAGGR
jgi:predicted nuclease of restriction endonuclease-like (RecB) superfamily